MVAGAPIHILVTIMMTSKKLTETSEVLIGEKANNQRERDHIVACEKQSLKILPIAFGIAAVVTLIMFFVTR